MKKIIPLFLIILALLYVSLGDQQGGGIEFTSNLPQDQQDRIEPVSTQGQKPDYEDPYAVALRALSSENFYKAIEYFEQVSPENPNYNDAMSYLKQAKEKLAQRLLKEAKNSFAAADYEVAVKSLEEALQYNPSLQEAKNLLKVASEKLQSIKRLEISGTMKNFEGEGSVAFAVKEAQLKNTAGELTATGNNTYLNIKIEVKNQGKQILRVIPNNFTLSTVDGAMSSIDYDTYSHPEYLKPIDLKPGESTSGWLIFHTIKGPEYTINYNGYNETVTKRIVP